MSIEEIEAEALKLDSQARARLAERLIESLETLSDQENERLWTEEANRRDTDLDSAHGASRPAAALPVSHYPLLFTFADKIAGNGFLAIVEARGRVLADREKDGWWLYGVQPGDISAGGETFSEAATEFRRAYTAILFDIAADVLSLQSFKEEIEEFFDGVSDPSLLEWRAAVDRVRSGKIGPAEVSETLKTGPADSPCYVSVKLLELPKPSDNVLDPPLALAA